MRGFNRVIIAGNLTRDPELRRTINQKAYARFGVAINSTWRNANGEVQDNTDYVTVVVWGAQAETCEKYLKKGSPVLIEGRIKTGSYDAKDGSGKRYTTEIYADNMIMLGSREGNSGGGNSQSRQFDAVPMPGDGDFGRSIGESGFGGSSATQDFASGSGMPESMEDSSRIPF